MASAIGWSALDHFCNKSKHSSDLDDVLDDAEKVEKGKGPSDVYEKDAGKDQKKQDFDKLNKGPVREIKTKDGIIKLGKTENGATIIDRDFSSERSGDKPTLEIQFGKNDYLKIRYND